RRLFGQVVDSVAIPESGPYPTVGQRRLTDNQQGRVLDQVVDGKEALGRWRRRGRCPDGSAARLAGQSVAFAVPARLVEEAATLEQEVLDALGDRRPFARVSRRELELAVRPGQEGVDGFGAGLAFGGRRDDLAVAEAEDRDLAGVGVGRTLALRAR